MPYKKTICVIVDAYSTGKYFAPSLRGRGYDCIHIKSSITLPENFQHITTDFIESWVHDEKGVDSLIAKLAQYNIKLIIAGSESGIELVDELNDRLNLPGNKLALSHVRRDKYLMNQEVSERGLKTVKQHESNSLESILRWTENLNALDWPVVLKPLSSQSGDHVFFCHDHSSIEAAFIEILNSTNVFGERNTVVLRVCATWRGC